jgi:hypothetical protein
MSGLVIIKPGKPGGPCGQRYCGHEWCVRDRRIAESKCLICGDAIGFEALCFSEVGAGDFPPTFYTHELCAAARAANP